MYRVGHGYRSFSSGFKPWSVLPGLSFAQDDERKESSNQICSILRLRTNLIMLAQLSFHRCFNAFITVE